MLARGSEAPLESNPAATARLGPTRVAERLQVLDLWRGFALLGVVIANFIALNDYFFTATRAASLTTFDLDWKTRLAVHVLVSNKFNTIFTFLFGMGLAIIAERAARANQQPTPFILRRMLVLLIIGWLNFLLVFPGELLHVYGICGLALLPLRRFSNCALVVAGLIAALLPRLIWDEWPLFSTHLFGEPLALAQATATGPFTDAAIEARRLIVHDGSWRQLMTNNLSFAVDFELDVGHRIPQALYFFGRMLLGFAFWRSHSLQKVIEINQRAPWICGTALGLGLGMALIGALVPAHPLGTAQHFWIDAMRQVAIIVSAAAYLLLAALVAQSSSFRGLVVSLCAAGRLSLTNYLLQGVAILLVLNGPGLRLAGNVGPTLLVPVALTVYGTQVAFSRWVVGRYQQGPFEWLWRQLTY